MILKDILAELSANKNTLYGTAESAELIGKSKPWFERHRWAGTGPKFQRIGRTPYYKGQALLDFICSSNNHEESGS